MYCVRMRGQLRGEGRICNITMRRDFVDGNVLHFAFNRLRPLLFSDIKDAIAFCFFCRNMQKDQDFFVDQYTPTRNDNI